MKRIGTADTIGPWHHSRARRALLIIGQIAYVARWAVAVVFIGLLVGVMAVLFSPLALAGVVALSGAFLLWALPELRLVPERSLRLFFFLMVFVQLSVPAYYAVLVPGLPWISVRRAFSSIVIVLFGIVVAGSMRARSTLVETLRANRALAVAIVGFLVAVFLSLWTSVSMSVSMSDFVNALLNWYIVLFACVAVVRNEDDIILVLKLIAIVGILVSLAGVMEFALERRFFFDLIPKSIIEPLLSSNPAMAAMYQGSPYRDGVYRASSIYYVSLSFAEFAAMFAPFGAYFVLHGREWRERILGFSSVISSLLAIFCSGSRGGWVSVLVAMPIMSFLWVVRYSKLNPNSLIGAFMGVIFVLGTGFTFVLVLFWQRLNRMVIGYDDSDRFLQWQMALPAIRSNPITGHGMGSSGTVVGYHLELGMPSVDSYLITLLVENGVLGCLLFFITIAIAIWIGLRVYLRDNDSRAAIGSALACSLIAFATYRLALSQTENHFFVFIIIGLIFVMGRFAHDRRISAHEQPILGAQQSWRLGSITVPGRPR